MENPLKYSLTVRFKDRHILNLLQPIVGKNVLDIGCGIGYLSSLFSSQGAKVFGVDVEPTAIEFCKKYVSGQFQESSAYNLPFGNDTFDYIVLADVIEHLENPGKALKEIVRVGKNGSQLVVSTPHLKGWLSGTWVLSLLHEEEDKHMADHEGGGYSVGSLSELMKNHSINPNTIRITNPYISQLFIGLTKLGYKTGKKRYSSQSELISISISWKFKLYKYTIFPLAYTLGRLEEKLLGNIIPGHCLIIRGSIRK